MSTSEFNNALEANKRRVLFSKLEQFLLLCSHYISHAFINVTVKSLDLVLDIFELLKFNHCMITETKNMPT